MKCNLKNAGCIGITLASMMMTANASPVINDTMLIRQPDQSIVKIIVNGDEFYQTMESLDGYSLVTDPETKWICYAKLNSDSSKLISTGVRYTGTSKFNGSFANGAGKENESKHIQPPVDKINAIINSNVKKIQTNFKASFPSQSNSFYAPSVTNTSVVGKIKGLTVLVKFPDQPETVSKSEAFNFLNQKNYSGFGNEGSIFDYFYDISGGKLEYNNIVEGYFMASKPKTYYESEDVEIGTRARELVMEVIKWIESSNMNLSEISTNNNGYVRALNICYSGYTKKGGLWSHQWHIESPYTAKGKTFYTYQVTGLHSDPETEYGPDMSVFCHETGHQLMSWRDLYDRKKIDVNGIAISKSMGVLGFDIMCYHMEKKPQTTNAYYRMLAGWENCIDISNDYAGKQYSLQANTNNSFKYVNPKNSMEMFIIEARNNNGRSKFDSVYLSDNNEGIMIWHIDEAFRDSGNDCPQMLPNSHYYISLEQANGYYNFETTFAFPLLMFSCLDDNLFSTKTTNRFNDYEQPNANWWSGEPSHINIQNISDVSSIMTFMRGEKVSLHTVSGYIKPEHTTAEKNPNSNFTVSLSNTRCSATTDSTGFFAFKNIPYNINGHTFQISKPSYLTRNATVPVITNISLGTISSPVSMWIGDLVAFGAINMSDIMCLNQSFNAIVGSSSYSVDKDLNRDGAINMSDYLIIAKHFTATSNSYGPVTIINQ